MNRMRGSRKQKRPLNDFHLLARRSFSSRNIRRFVLRPRFLIVGLAATIGVSSFVIAAAQQNTQIKANLSSSTGFSSDSSADANNTSKADITIDASASETANPSNNNSESETDTQVTINGENIPVNNGTVHRTITSDNGSLDVDVSINSSSSSNSRSNSSTRIDIDAGSNSSIRSTIRSNSTSRGSP